MITLKQQKAAFPASLYTVFVPDKFCTESRRYDTEATPPLPLILVWSKLTFTICVSTVISVACEQSVTAGRIALVEHILQKT